MAVSLEELVTHDSQVVCPQCLAVCLYQNGKLEARDDSDAPGISFCPYCGADLSAPFDKQETSAIKQPVKEPQPQVKPQPVQEKPQPAVRKPQATAAPQDDRNRVEEKLRTVSRHYTSVHPRLHQNGTMPSLAFKIFAYAIIAILLILLVVIIVAGNSLEPAM